MAKRVALEQPEYFAGRAGPGRGKGTPNKTTRILREAVILAAEQMGRDGKGKEGLVGYLKKLADKHPDLFVGLLGRVLPMQLVGPSDGPVKVEVELTLPEMQRRLEEEGIPLSFDPPVTLLPPARKQTTNGHARNGS